jgi:hypothetical protein
MYCTQSNQVTALLPIKGVIHMMMQNLTFYRKPIFFPLLVNMYQSPLAGTESEMLYSRKHEHIIFAIHMLN